METGYATHHLFLEADLLPLPHFSDLGQLDFAVLAILGPLLGGFFLLSSLNLLPSLLLRIGSGLT